MEYEELRAKIREVPDFPIDGVNFRDITPLLEDKETFHETISALTKLFANKEIDKVAGIDARGFVLSSAVAYTLHAGSVMIRKSGKLPYEKITQTFKLEYGRGEMEIHKDSIKKGERVVIIDDLLATGGTGEAATKLVEKLGGEIVGLGFLIELLDMNGRQKLGNYEVHSLLKF